MAGKRVHFVMPAELVERIDASLGEGQSRGEWVRKTVERALSEAEEPSRQERADPGSVPRVGAGSAAPAEQPSEEELAALRESFERTSGNYPREPERPLSRSEMFKRASQR